MFLQLLITFISFSRVLAQSTNAYQLVHLNSSSGLYYEKIGTLKVCNNEWTMINYIDLDNYQREFETLSYYVESLNYMCEKAQPILKKIGKNEWYPRVIFSSALNETLVELNKTNQIIREIIPHTIRQKRGLFDAVGKISKTLFGTMDADDAAYYDEKIKSLDKNQDDIANLMKEQISVVEGVLKDFNLTMSTTNQHMLDVEGKVFNLLQRVNQLSIAQSETNELTSFLAHLNILVEIIELFLSKFMSHQSKLFNIILSAQHGQLHPLIISPTSLLSELEKIHKHLPLDTSFPIQLSLKNAYILYKLIHPTVYYYKEKLVFLLNIPLRSEPIFNLYKITSFPVLVQQQTYAFSVPEKPYLAVDDMKQYYFLLNDLELKDCTLIFDKDHICRNTKSVMRTHSQNGCEAQLFIDGLSVPSSCETRMLTLKYPLFLQLAQQNAWIFVMPFPTNMDIKCQNQEDTSILLRNTGVINISKNCTGITSRVILHSHNDFTNIVSVTFKPFLEFKHFLFPSLPEALPTISLEKTVVVSNSETHFLKSTGEHLESLKHKISDFEKAKATKIYTYHFSTLYSIIGLIFVIVLSVYFFKLLKLKCKRTSPQNIQDIVILKKNVVEDNTTENRTPASSNPRYNFHN
jgi:Baculovirus F protein